jgi:hypothetical protein
LLTFEIGFCVYNQVGPDLDPPIYASHIAGMTGCTTTPSFCWLRWESCEIFARAGFKPWSSNLYFLSS